MRQRSKGKCALSARILNTEIDLVFSPFALGSQVENACAMHPFLCVRRLQTCAENARFQSLKLRLSYKNKLFEKWTQFRFRRSLNAPKRVTGY